MFFICVPSQNLMMMIPSLNSQQRPSVHSRNPNDFWMKLDVKSQRTENGHNFVLSIPFLVYLGSSLVKQKFKPLNGRLRANHHSLFCLEQAQPARYAMAISLC
jgi:hypothetical protein